MLERMNLDGKLAERQASWAVGAAKSALTNAGDAVTYTNLALDLADLVPFIPLSAATTTAIGLTAFGITTGCLARRAVSSVHRLRVSEFGGNARILVTTVAVKTLSNQGLLMCCLH
jgi:hypothetical protein